MILDTGKEPVSYTHLDVYKRQVGQLTPVERELVRLLLQNYKVGQIAELRVVELVTVKTQIKSLLRKFNCTRTKEIVNLIHELKLEHLFL